MSANRTDRETDPHDLPLPTFLIIGAQKSATRWLRVNLGLHPDVFVYPSEVEFFNNGKRFALGVPWYREQFEGWSGEMYVGEATPGYMHWRHRGCVERIHTVLPDARLVALLRNPIDRAQSAVVHHVATGKLPRDTELLEYVRATPPPREPLGIITGGWYDASLEPFRRLFGDQLLVTLHDDIKDDPHGLYARVLGHVGASAGFEPPELERSRFSNRDRPGFDPPAKRTLTIDERRELYEYFAADVARLEESLDRDLSHWRPA